MSAPASANPGDAALPVVGAVWREKYAIVEALAAAPGSQSWKATCVDGGQPVVLRAFKPAEPEIRAQVWSKLGGIDSPHVQHPRDAQRAGEWRIEVADAPRGLPIPAWRAARPAVDADTVKAIVVQLTEALAAMHAFELVHLGLSPAAVHVFEHDGNVECMIAGLDNLTTFDRKESVPAPANPLYAPPETLGLNLHVPGPGLCAWDWWSLGRVVQEIVLGHHIVQDLPDLVKDSRAGDPLARAETLLHEAEAKGPRAGAVEKMAGLDPQLQVLLRGLLTSAKDARWTGDNVDRWVRGQSVKEFYDTPRAETHFRWRGRPCTVPEIAAILQSAEHWAENSVQLFEATTPGTLAHFLRWSTTQSLAHESLISSLELGDSLPLKLSSPAARREAVTMVALVVLSAGKLIWRGRPFEPATVPAMLTELGEADGLMVLRALTTRSIALQIERIDQAAGRLLAELGRVTADVESACRRHGWLAQNDVAANARLFRLALEPLPNLKATRDELAKTFAGSDHAAVEKLFKLPNPGRAELVLLAWGASIPEVLKFYTHEEAARRRAKQLRDRGVELTQALAWLQFERALQTGRIVFGGWGWFLLAWLLLGVVAAVLWPGVMGVALAFVPLVAALALRFAGTPQIRRSLQATIAGAHWSWRDGPKRCRRELRVAGSGKSGDELETELAKVKDELKALADVKPTPEPLPALPSFRRVQIVGVVAWVLFVAGLGGAGWRYQAHRPTLKEIKAAWAPVPAKPEAKPVVAAGAKEEEKETKISWPYRNTGDTTEVPVRATQSATSAQVEFAVSRGRDIVAPYRPDTINTLVVLPVPDGDNISVMLFDGKRGELANQNVFRLEFRPLPRTWVEVNGRKGVYLDH
ncbi:hypothetical protein [Opitutus sp. ER46]|uniref:hypothetical protein n=1 Tax=Opitutus sp. ER46 TaxID=2161864 RepID=UPI00130504A1|nr:hypothetical protein [Opitutus sp. ER46]